MEQSFANSTIPLWQQQILSGMKKQSDYLNTPEGVHAFMASVSPEGEGIAAAKFGNALRESVPHWASNNMLNLPEQFVQSMSNPNKLINTTKSLIPDVAPLEFVQSSARKLLKK